LKSRIAALAAVLVLTMAAAAQAATFTVTTTNDDQPANAADCSPDAAPPGCSLREAVFAANETPGDDRIDLPAGDYALTNETDDPDGDADLDVLSVNSSLQAAGALAIVGNNARDTQIRSPRSDVTSRIFEVFGGDSFDPDGGGPADCTDFPGAALELRNVKVTDGATSDNGGGIRANDGASTCAGTDAPSTDSRLTAIDTAIVGNAARDEGGGIYSAGEVTLVNSAVTSNESSSDGGGVYTDDTLTMTNVTVGGNVAGDDGGGIRAFAFATEPTSNGGDETTGVVEATNVTIAYNETDGGGGGIASAGFFNNTPSLLYVRNTIIAHNRTHDDQGTNCFRATTTVSEGFNLESEDTCGLDGSGDQTNTDAGLLTRANNGGQTDTYALSEPSPARDGGTNEDCPATDQRGVARPIGPRCDIGAFEAPLPAPPQPPTVVREVVEVPTAFQRVSPRRLSLTVRKTRPTTRSLRLRSTGRVVLPAGLTAAQACTFGFVAVQVKANGKTVSTRIVQIRRDCRYTSAVTFNALSRIRNRTLTVRARFFGNDRLRTRFSARRSAGRA
jgi:CSLREA domain-containing protein